jgi:hypothetical protein
MDWIKFLLWREAKASVELDKSGNGQTFSLEDFIQDEENK